MENGNQNNEEVLEKMRKQLAVAVRSIQWSYAIFWSLSTTDEGVLEWGEGYYNGDIKTRKTVQAMELKAEKMGLKRSKQLRELYKSLSEAETDQQAKRTSSSALSPEDLTDAEWYYLVCMSFVFSLGQSLPGQALANGQTIWLCNAQHADSKVFSRSLLAKSASIQTVVCFPHLDGVIEIGVTDLVSEDLNLLQHIKASLLDFSKPVCTAKSCHPADYDDDDDKDQMCTRINHEIEVPLELDLENLSSPSEDISSDLRDTDKLNGNHEHFNLDSPDECSNVCDHNHQTEDSFMPEAIDGGASQVQSWHFIDYGFSNGVQLSINSNDCKSEAFINQEKTENAVILNNAVKFLKKLEESVEELASCKNSVNNEAQTRKKNLQMVEQTSDIYDNKKVDNGRNTLMHKRKACDINETDGDPNRVVHKDGLPLNSKVGIKDQEVQIDIRCPHKECILDIMDAINYLHLDFHSIQSSNLGGVFTLTLKSKFRGTAIASVGMIKQGLWKAAGEG